MYVFCFLAISIHVPLRGGRPHLYMRQKHAQNFNPRPPTRGTTAYILHDKDSWDISIHVPLRGGRRKCNAVKIVIDKFQSTSPYAGDDAFPKATNGTRCYFNPRPPTRGTTEIPFEAFCKVLISIHVPLRGGRQHRKRQIAIGKRFQSTSPYAGDDITAASSRGKQITFQSTSPYAGDDYGGEDFTAYTLVFQSTSPYAGDDSSVHLLTRNQCNFNPRPPTRGTTTRACLSWVMFRISIHVPLRGGRPNAFECGIIIDKFQSTSPYAGDD